MFLSYKRQHTQSNPCFVLVVSPNLYHVYILCIFICYQYSIIYSIINSRFISILSIFYYYLSATSLPVRHNRPNQTVFKLSKNNYFQHIRTCIFPYQSLLIIVYWHASYLNNFYNAVLIHVKSYIFSFDIGTFNLNATKVFYFRSSILTIKIFH